MEQVARYIFQNPVVDGIATSLKEWGYSISQECIPDKLVALAHEIDEQVFVERNIRRR